MLKQNPSSLQSVSLPDHHSYDYLPSVTSHGVAGNTVAGHGVTSPRLILLADHAGSALPEAYGSLGLEADQFHRHIAYDIGVREVVLHLAKALDAPALMGNYSRLLIDLNRGLDDPTLIMKLSDGSVVPGNAMIDEVERSQRIVSYFKPYHRAIDQLIDHSIKDVVTPVLLSIHSFTPHWKGVERPWHASVLWDKDGRLVHPLLSRMRDDGGLTIGDNVPYSGELVGDTLNTHGTKRGIAHALIEIRQDLIADDKGQREWADRLGSILKEIMVDENFNNALK